jgi:transcriptional regulator with XRE-family HTH domain
MTDNELIQKLGGTCAVAEVFGVTSNAVSRWKAARTIPSARRFKLWQYARANGIELPVEFLDAPQRKRRNGHAS